MERAVIVLLIEALFALVFLRSLVAYSRHRDPLQGGVTLVFSAVAVLFVLEIMRRIFGTPPLVVSYVATILLLAQPYLTLRLVRMLRPVPAWVMWGALAAFAFTTGPLLLARRPAPLAVVLAAVFAFLAVQAVAAAFLIAEARHRTGSPRTRLILAGIATAMFAVALLAASAGAANPHATAAGRQLSSALALISAVGYAIAFLPPGWLRRWWSAAAAYQVHRRLMSASATEPPEETWRRYATVVRTVAGADGAIVLLPADGHVTCAASAGLDAGTYIDAAAADVDRLLAMPQPVRVPAGRDLSDPVLRIAQRAGARLLTAVPLQLPAGQGTLLLLGQRRSLFAEDDARLLGELGAQAAILAERGAVRAEQERLATELAASVRALSAASQAKSDFLSSMSHELRTPLNAIIGFSELMRGEPGTDDRRTIPAEWIEHVYASGRHLLGLINDILDLAKIEAGRMELRPEVLDLPELIGEVVTTLRPLVDAKSQRLSTVVPPVTVRADRTRLRQILDNLLSNAIKFTPDGGAIFVGVSDSPTDVQITVADTGPGIAPADHARVFEEFQQVGDPAKHQAGTGLGLALSRRLAEAHGGRIELASELGAGARFTVHLPNLAPTAEAAVSSAPPPAGSSVLLIEDEPSAARLLRTYLETAGYGVTIARSGEDGLATARRSRPDAILLDVQLPGIDGWNVLRKLKRDRDLASVPVFMVTVLDDRDAGLALGAADFFVKPIDRHLLLARLAEQLVPANRDDETQILVIDDDPATLEVIETSLRQQGFQVTTTSSGQDGLRLARSGRYDLIISDLVMPDIDGLTLIGALDDEPATRGVPVLVLTARDLTEADRADLSGKVLGILPKGQAVHEALRSWLASPLRPERQV